VKWLSIICAAAFALLISACSAQPDIPSPENAQEQREFNLSVERYESTKASYSQKINAVLYFADANGTMLTPEVRSVSVDNEKDTLKKVLEELIKGPVSAEMKSLIPADTQIRKVEQLENIAVLDLSSQFLEAENLRGARMAVVNTLTDMNEIQYVKIYVEGKELTCDGKEGGAVLGLMSKYPNNIEEVAAAESETVNDANAEKVERELYFTDSKSSYLLAEVQRLSVCGKEYAKAVVEALIKGPIQTKDGLYPTLPKGTHLLDIHLKDAKSKDGASGVEVYFSKEFKTQFSDTNTELTTLGSLVYSLTALPDISWVKVYYQDEDGEYIDQPVRSMDLSVPLTRAHFPNLLGRRIKVYFSDKNSQKLIPEYRAISINNTDLYGHIVAELAAGPSDRSNLVGVIPSELSAKDIKVWVEGDRAVVNLPAQLKAKANQMGSAGEIMMLFALVNSLTDPVNTKTVKQVQFLIDGILGIPGA
jgi:spore germination protein GerM